MNWLRSGSKSFLTWVLLFPLEGTIIKKAPILNCITVVNMVEDDKENRIMIVAVDGPAGSGKSSICALVCEKLGWNYINTGFLYRTVGVLAQQRQISLHDTDAVIGVVEELQDHLKWDPDTGSIHFKGENLTPFLETSEAGSNASLVAKIPSVREKLLPLQRELTRRSSRNSIVDGRDIGTVVFPDADLKIFMTASIEERARRRFTQLQGASSEQNSLDLATIQDEIAKRDQQDAQRGTAPLLQADDAILFDTSSLDVVAAVDNLIGILKEKDLI